MAQSQQIKEITDKLEQGIKELFESENYINYLKCMSRFTDYSFNNTILISMQRPNSSLVAGFRKWNEFNRYVRKGEKGIKILAPCIYKAEKEDGDNGTEKSNKDDAEERVLKGFRVVHVFDISQTEGEELPTITHELDGTVEGYSDFMTALKQISPAPIEFKKIEGSANGYYHLTDKNIVIDTGMSEMMNCKTTIHEIAHAILHNQDDGAEKDVDRHTKEVQAESTAFVVCQYYGLDVSDYSFGYIAGWSSGKDAKELKASLDTIRQTADKIIKGIDQQLDTIKQAKQIQPDKDKSISKDAPTKAHKRHIRR
mgnify:CR=1 FL=1